MHLYGFLSIWYSPITCLGEGDQIGVPLGKQNKTPVLTFIYPGFEYSSAAPENLLTGGSTNMAKVCTGLGHDETKQNGPLTWPTGIRFGAAYFEQLPIFTPIYRTIGGDVAATLTNI